VNTRLCTRPMGWRPGLTRLVPGIPATIFAPAAGPGHVTGRSRRRPSPVMYACPRSIASGNHGAGSGEQEAAGAGRVVRYWFRREAAIRVGSSGPATINCPFPASRFRPPALSYPNYAFSAGHGLNIPLVVNQSTGHTVRYSVAARPLQPIGGGISPAACVKNRQLGQDIRLTCGAGQGRAIAASAPAHGPTARKPAGASLGVPNRLRACRGPWRQRKSPDRVLCSPVCETAHSALSTRYSVRPSDARPSWLRRSALPGALEKPGRASRGPFVPFGPVVERRRR
jgi:hypothetical protein